ncbi:MAG: FliM/FliN family flagellar motor switch protein [Woeseiaceae bacterium]
MTLPEVSLCPADLHVVDRRRKSAQNAVYSSVASHSDGYAWRWQSTPSRAIDYWIRLQSGEQQLWLGIAAAVVSEDIEFLWREFDGDAQLLAWCASHVPLLTMVEQVFQKDWSPVEFCERPQHSDTTIDAEFTIRRDGRCQVVGCCVFEQDQLPLPVADGVPSDFLQRLPVAIPIVVDRASFAVQELRQLEIGAVVRVQRRAFLDIGATLRLGIGGTELLVKVTGTQLTVVSIKTKATNVISDEERAMTSSEQTIDKSADDGATSNDGQRNPIDIESMPIDVRFEAGRLLTRYDELCRLQPGYTYELGQTLGENTINITANGVLIARGELVSIGDQLGVRITTLAHGLGTSA